MPRSLLNAFNPCRPTNDPSIDTFRVEYLLGPCVLLSLIFNYKFTLAEILWSFSIFLESVAILPQLFMLQRTGEAETITTHYLAALGAYRAFYIPNWIYRCVPHLMLSACIAHPNAQVLDRRRGRPDRGYGGHRTDGVVPRFLLRLLHKVSLRKRFTHAHADVSLRLRVSSQPITQYTECYKDRSSNYRHNLYPNTRCIWTALEVSFHPT